MNFSDILLDLLAYSVCNNISLLRVIRRDRYVAFGSQLFRMTFSYIVKVLSFLQRAYQRIHRPQLEIAIWHLMTLFLRDINVMRIVRPWIQGTLADGRGVPKLVQYL